MYILIFREILKGYLTQLKEKITQTIESCPGQRPFLYVYYYDISGRNFNFQGLLVWEKSFLPITTISNQS